MFKRMTLMATWVALLSTSAHASLLDDATAIQANAWNDAAPDVQLNFSGIWLSGGETFSNIGDHIKYKLTFIDINKTVETGQTFSIDVLEATSDGRALAGFPSKLTCELDYDYPSQPIVGCSGIYTVTAGDIGKSITPAVKFRTSATAIPHTLSTQNSVSYDAPPFDDSQHANVEGVLMSHLDRKIRQAGEVVRFAFNVSNLTRAIPAGDYVRVEYGATDIVRNDGSLDNNVDFGLTCPSVGSGVPVGGSFACTGSYTVRQADIDAGGFLLALGVALSTRDFALYGGSVMENFEVDEVAEPETPKPEDEEKTACKPMPLPSNGAKFVFRYRTGAICS